MLHISCNMGTCDLPEVYAQSPQAVGMHIRQITHAYDPAKQEIANQWCIIKFFYIYMDAIFLTTIGHLQ